MVARYPRQASGRRLGTQSGLRHRQSGLAAALILPPLILLAFFVLRPAFATLYESFFHWDGMSPQRSFVGLNEYLQALKTPELRRALLNSAIWGAVGMAIPTAIGLITAAMVEDSQVPFKPLFRLGFFLPYFFSIAVAAALFTRVYDPTYGLLNSLLRSVGLPGDTQWLGDTRYALAAAIVLYIWHETAFCFIIYSAAIRQIDREQYDAARVDGASAIQVFRYVTVPAVRPVTTVVAALMLIGGLTPFAIVFALTNPGLGGPYYATEVLPTLIYKAGVQGYNAGQAAAMSVLLVFVVAAASSLVIVALRRGEE